MVDTGMSLGSITTDQVATVHPTYTTADEDWQTIEDICDGSRCVKRVGERYLPKLEDQSNAEYRAYKDRATFVNFTKRTREALGGMLLRKQPEIEFADAEVEKMTEDITLAGHTILDWIRLVCDQGVSTGRSATVIDWSDTAKRPYMAHYKARDVLNWASVREEGGEKLCFLVLRELDEVLEDFTVHEVVKIRRYWIPEDGTVWSDLWIQATGDGSAGKEGDAQFKKDGDDIQLKRNGKPLSKMPAVIHNATHLGPEIGEAPLADIAEINVSHYRSSADLENGRHICGLPTPYATGVTDNGDLRLGASKAWVAEDPQAQFGFIEFNGEGLGSLTTALKEKSEQMAILGARLLFNDSNDAEAFETVQLRATSETAALSNISGTLSATLTQALQWFHWWTETSEQPPEEIKATIMLSKDFTASQMAPNMLTALTNALNTSSISMETFFHNLRQGELYPPDWDLENETRAISQQAPTAPPVSSKPPTE